MTTTSRGAGASDGALVLTLPEHAMNAALVRASAMIIRVRSAYILVLHYIGRPRHVLSKRWARERWGREGMRRKRRYPFMPRYTRGPTPITYTVVPDGAHTSVYSPKVLASERIHPVPSKLKKAS